MSSKYGFENDSDETRKIEATKQRREQLELATEQLVARYFDVVRDIFVDYFASVDLEPVLGHPVKLDKPQISQVARGWSIDVKNLKSFRRYIRRAGRELDNLKEEFSLQVWIELDEKLNPKIEVFYPEYTIFQQVPDDNSVSYSRISWDNFRLPQAAKLRKILSEQTGISDVVVHEYLS